MKLSSNFHKLFLWAQKFLKKRYYTGTVGQRTYQILTEETCKVQREKLSKMKEHLQLMNKKKILFAVLAVIFLCVLAVLLWRFVLAGEDDTQMTQAAAYQEEMVSRGDIVVGLSETGSVSMDSHTVSLAFETSIEEILVTAGTYVSEGEALLQLDTEDFSALLQAKENELAAANLQLQQAQIDSGVQTANADMVYQNSVQSGNTAAGIYSLQLAELDSGYVTIQNEVATLETQKAEIERQISQGLDNDHGLAGYQSELAAIDTQITTVQAQIAHASTCPGAQDATCTHPQDSHDVAALEATLSQLNTQRTAKAAQVSSAQTEYDKSFQELQTQLTTVQNSLTQKYNERDSYVANMPLQQLEYSNQYNASIHESNTAQGVHDSAMTQVETSLTQAQQAVDTLTAEMDMFSLVSEQGVVSAPVDGFVLSLAEEDTTLQANTALVTLADDQNVYFSVSISQDDIADITIGMQASVLMDAYEDEVLTGMVESISIVPSGSMQSSVNYTVLVACDLSALPDLVVYQGMTAEVTFVQRQVEDVLIVSNKCIQSEDGAQYVQLLAEDGSIERVQVQTGFSDGFDVEITGGLTEGDTVLIENVVASNESE